MSRSSRSSRAAGHDDRPWLKRVYHQRQQRTAKLVKASVDALRVEKKRVSLSSIEAKSKQLDPEKKGVHRNSILDNEEARAYYEKHRNWKKRKRTKPAQSEKISENTIDNFRPRIKFDRDINSARRRYDKLTKSELVERLLLVEQAYAEAEEIWLRDKDEALTWQLRATEAEALLRERDSASAKRGDSGAADFIRTGEYTNTDQPPPNPLHPQFTSPTDLNRYEYFAEIEELFIRRRGKHLLLSPLDWALMEGWKEQGIPLHVVLRAIGDVFDRHEARGQRRSVKSLHYCKEEVEAQFSEWLQGRIGAARETQEANVSAGDPTPPQDESLPFPRAEIIEHLARCRAEYMRERDEQVIGRGSELFTTLSRVASRLQELEEGFAQTDRPDVDKLERSLTELDIIVGHAIRAHLSPTQLAKKRHEAEGQLRAYRGRMELSTYEQTLDNIVFKRLREEWGVPRLSLFYL